MKILFVSAFENKINSGASGSLLAIGENIKILGHEVDYIWQKRNRIILNNNYYRFFELPYVQYFQIKSALKFKSYDIVSISQPHAWFAIKQLKKSYSNTIFINRTHGWEQRGEEVLRPYLIKGIKRKISYSLVSYLTNTSSLNTVKYSDAIITLSISDSNYIKKEYPKFQKKVYQIGYGLDKSYINLPYKYETQSNKTKFIFCGQYLARKGINDLIKIFKEIIKIQQNFDLTFVVPENATESVKKDFSFLKNLKVFSWMKRSELINRYLDSDVFLMPSYFEGYGKTSIEAMACGLCVIGYKEGCLEDIGNCENSLLTSVGEISELKKNIMFAINNRDKIIKLGLAAYSDVQNLTWENTAIKTLRLFQKLIT